MAIPWLLVLRSVPWTEVIRNAPKVADGARKLWSSVAGSSATSPVASARQGQSVVRSPEERSLAGLEARVLELEDTVADLHAQMLASSEVIKALAEQNTQLIARVEANRVRALWMISATAVVGVIAITSVAMSAG